MELHSFINEDRPIYFDLAGIDRALVAQNIPTEDIDDDFMFEFNKLHVIKSYSEFIDVLERT